MEDQFIKHARRSGMHILHLVKVASWEPTNRELKTYKKWWLEEAVPEVLLKQHFLLCDHVLDCIRFRDIDGSLHELDVQRELCMDLLRALLKKYPVENAVIYADVLSDRREWGVYIVPQSNHT